MATSIRTAEQISKLTKASATTLTYPASRTNVGPYQYVNASPITLSTGTVGFNGVDATLQNSTLYYVYAVVQSGNLGMCASTSSTGPAGFSQSRMVGSFNTDSSGNIALVEPAFDGNTTNTGLLTVTGGIAGKIDGTTIAAGVIGERIAATGSVAIVNSGGTNVASIPLTPGIWDLSAGGYAAGISGLTQAKACITAVSGTMTNSPGDSQVIWLASSTLDTSAHLYGIRAVISGVNTPYYLVMQIVGATSTTGYGRISAVRVG